MYRYLDMKLPTSGYEILVIMHSPKQNNQKIVTTFSILKFKCHQSDSFCKDSTKSNYLKCYANVFVFNKTRFVM